MIMKSGFSWGPLSKAGQMEREMALRADVLEIGRFGPIGAMRRASSGSHVIRIGLEVLRFGFNTEIVSEGLEAYVEKRKTDGRER